MKLNATKHATHALRADKAPAYFTSSGHRNWEPALLWLVVAVVGLNWLRTGQTPSGQQAVTWAGLCAGVVVVGAFAPRLVALVLVGLLLASALNLNNKLTAYVDTLTSQVNKLGRQG
jgi:uncharacterized membrane protein YphA (DoxX/SURF4 family)